mgnify:CR=1 FL=1
MQLPARRSAAGARSRSGRGRCSRSSCSACGSGSPSAKPRERAAPRRGARRDASRARWRSSPAASRGIGAAIARDLAAAGRARRRGLPDAARGGGCGRRGDRDAGRLRGSDQLRRREYREVDAAVRELVARLGKVDVLVNNAGVSADALIVRISDEQWQRVLDVNPQGVFNCTKAVARPMMRARSGRIINLSSVVGVTGNTGQAAYAAAKAGIIGFTKSTARELASRGITANVVAPGLIETGHDRSPGRRARETCTERMIPSAGSGGERTSPPPSPSRGSRRELHHRAGHPHQRRYVRVRREHGISGRGQGTRDHLRTARRE